MWATFREPPSNHDIKFPIEPPLSQIVFIPNQIDFQIKPNDNRNRLEFNLHFPLSRFRS